MSGKFSNPFEILLVEDNLSDVDLTRRALQQVDSTTRVHHAVDGVEAMEFLHREGKFVDSPLPNLILLDLNMPRMDGKELLREIQSDDRLNSIPIVILTTSNREQDVQESYALGAQAYIVKPVDVHEFFDVIRTTHEFWRRTVTATQPE